MKGEWLRKVIPLFFVCLWILTAKLQFSGEFAAVDRALTKTFIHNPFMGANPIGFK